MLGKWNGGIGYTSSLSCRIVFINTRVCFFLLFRLKKDVHSQLAQRYVLVQYRYPTLEILVSAIVN